LDHQGILGRPGPEARRREGEVGVIKTWKQASLAAGVLDLDEEPQTFREEVL
jgi:hypothetical protein